MRNVHALTRSHLDRLAIETNGRVRFGCPTHPDRATVSLYQDGCMRVLCCVCGFEAARIKVADVSVESLGKAA